MSARIDVATRGREASGHPPLVRYGRIGPIAARYRARSIVLAGVLTAIIVAVVLVGVLHGTTALSPREIVAALAGHGTAFEQLVVDRRLGRGLAAVVVGAMLGISGGLTQTITRNPIATPDILGVTAGAGVFAVLVVGAAELTGASQPSSALISPAALLGALVTTAAVLGLSWRAGFDGYRVILVGLAVNAMAMSGTSWILATVSLDTAAIATRWLVGSLDGARLADVAVVAPVLLIAIVVVIVLTHGLRSLSMGSDVARTLGTPSGRIELCALVVAVVLVGAAITIGGPIPFVAFLAPQLALRLFRTPGPPPLTAGLVGALVLLASDTVCQYLPAALPVGVATAVVGAPYLLVILLRRRRISE